MIYKDSGEVKCDGEYYPTTEVLVYTYRNFFT